MCIRDSINALNFILNSNGTHIWNLGSGNGYSVLEAVRSFEKAIQIDLNIKFCSRRDGDIPISFASTLKAENDLLGKQYLDKSFIKKYIEENIKGISKKLI